MALSKLFSQLKGSSRSGNYGHQGRVGKRGGSFSTGILSDPSFVAYIKDQFPHNKNLLSKLQKLDSIPKGEYLGDKGAHTCQTNAKNCGGLHVGYVISKGSDGFNLSHHWFNVKDSKVNERTDLELSPGEDWKRDYNYLGLAVPEKLAKTGSYSKIDKWFDEQVS